MVPMAGSSVVGAAMQDNLACAITLENLDFTLVKRRQVWEFNALIHYGARVQTYS